MGTRSSALLIAVLMAAAGAGVILTGCGGDHGAGTEAKEEQLYTCGMHPQVIQNKPGNCPICDMKLTPVRKQAGAKSALAAAATESTAITIDPVTIQNMDLRTGLVTRGPLRRVVRTVGVVDFDETALTDVTTKFKGWIEKLYVDATGQQVHRGEPLFDIYSPELYSAQVEYLLALNQPTNLAGAGAEDAQGQCAGQAEVPRHSGRANRGSRARRPGKEESAHQRAARWHRGREDGGGGPDGRGRDEAVPAGRPGHGLGAVADLRAGPAVGQARAGSHRQPVLPARPQVPRARHLHLSRRWTRRRARPRCGWSFTTPAIS